MKIKVKIVKRLQAATKKFIVAVPNAHLNLIKCYRVEYHLSFYFPTEPCPIRETESRTKYLG